MYQPSNPKIFTHLIYIKDEYELLKAVTAFTEMTMETPRDKVVYKITTTKKIDEFYAELLAYFRDRLLYADEERIEVKYTLDKEITNYIWE